jgi:dihydrofolate synthase/folylpolyglutamate synthase
MMPQELKVFATKLSAPVVHIAGSKGKGSTAFILSKIMEMSGITVGLFSSPHIMDIRECVRINGEPVERLEIEEHDGLSEFELLFLEALKTFEAEACDLIILECGWGGAKDATNLVDEKVLCILTHVELEHTEVLGNSVTEITREKLGICRPGVPLITSSTQAQEVFEVMEEMGITPILAPSFEMGHHHPESVGMAVAAAEQLGITMTAEMFKVIENLQLPGRFEVIHFGIHTLVLDGAHTYDSVQFVESQIREYAMGEELPEPIWAIHFLKDKSEELPKLFARNRSVWLTLEDERAGTCPDGFQEIGVNKFLAQLKADPVPKCIGILGSFRLVKSIKLSLA